MSSADGGDDVNHVGGNKQVVATTSYGGQGCSCSSPKPPPPPAGLHRRCGKRCRRLEGTESSRPDVDEDEDDDMKRPRKFGEDEEDLIIKLHALVGDRWSLIAGRLPGRTDNEIENYWNSHVKGKLIDMGIDPNNHRPNQTLHPAVVADPDDDGLSDATSSLQEDE